MAVETTESGMTVVTGADTINVARPLALKAMLKLEVVGMARRGPSAYSIVKKEYKLKGDKKSVLAQFETILREKGILKS